MTRKDMHSHMVEAFKNQAWWVRVLRHPRVSAALAVALFFFMTFDTWLFLRTFLAVFGIVITPRRKRALTEVSEIRGRVMLTDLDWLLHMSNSKYLRELDFGRVDFWLGCGLYQAMRKKGWHFVLGAMNIRFRRELNLFQSFKITTRLLAWDDTSFYLEQRFVGRSGFVHAIALAKQTLVGGGTPARALELIGMRDAVTPQPPPDLALWIESMQMSSAALRREAGLPAPPAAATAPAAGDGGGAAAATVAPEPDRTL